MLDCISIHPLDVILALVARIQAGARYATCLDSRDKPEMTVFGVMRVGYSRHIQRRASARRKASFHPQDYSRNKRGNDAGFG